MRRLAAALLFVMVIAGPAIPQEPPPPPPPEPKDKPAPTAESTEFFQKEMTAIRGLAFKKKVTVGEYSREELLAFLKKEMERELPKDQAEKIRQALVHFGLIPTDLDLYQTVIDLLGAAIAGFYHPKTKELRLIKGGFGGADMERDMTLVHELCHAAQDQNFDLNTLPIELKTNDDVVMAVQALVEGDATIVGLKWMLKERYEQTLPLVTGMYKSGELGEETRKVPACLRKSLAFPYGYGTEFVQALLNKAKDDWTEVSKAFSDLPGSTEQILHPKKYFGEARDYPQDIAIEGVEKFGGEGWTYTYHNVNGEFGTRLVLDEFKVQTAALRKSAAEGWDGDRYFIFVNKKGANAGIWFTTWDSEDDAKEFFAAYDLLLTAKYEGAPKSVTEQTVTITGKNGTQAILERRGADVVVLDGFEPAAAGNLNKIWSSAKKTEVKKVDRVEKK